MRSHITAALALTLVVAACASDTAETTTTAATTTTTTTTTSTTTTTTTTMPTTTTTTLPTVHAAPDGFRSPVNGLGGDEEFLDRRAITVKIDNHPKARPQTGVDSADAVIEILVEGGLTRWIAVFHASDMPYLGPVRSVRPTDSTLLPAIPAVIAMSGGQGWVKSLARDRGVTVYEKGEAAMFRVSERVGPHNLFVDTSNVRSAADADEIADEPPQWLYPVDDWVIPEAPATQLVLTWSGGQVVTWRYDSATEKYTRWYGDTPHTLVSQEGVESQIAVDVLVVIVGHQYTEWPPSWAPDSARPVPATETVGSGTAWVLSKGAMWTGTWEREEFGDRFTLRNADGSEAVVPAGIPWVSIFPDDQELLVS